MERAHCNGIKIMMDGMGADLLLCRNLIKKFDGKNFEYGCSGKISDLLRRGINAIYLYKERKQNDRISDVKILSKIDALQIPEEDRAKNNVPNSLLMFVMIEMECGGE